MFEDFRRKRKIKNFARRLPKKLVALFGEKKYYSQGQVKLAARESFRQYRKPNTTSNDLVFAYAMFCTPTEFNNIQHHLDESCDYESLREEISQVCFNNTNGFNFATLDALSTYDSSFSSSSDAGGFSDGGGGGGD